MDRYSWLAVRGPGKENVAALLHLRPTGEPADYTQSEFSLTELKDDIVLVVSSRFEFADQAPLAELSADGDVVTCCVNEEMMYSSSSAWSRGKRQWYYFHDGGLGIQHMHTEGELPAEYHAVANRLMVAQAEGEGIAITVDHVFEVAPTVANALVGFRYDEENGTTRQFLKLIPE